MARRLLRLQSLLPPRSIVAPNPATPPALHSDVHLRSPFDLLSASFHRSATESAFPSLTYHPAGIARPKFLLPPVNVLGAGPKLRPLAARVYLRGLRPQLYSTRSSGFENSLRSLVKKPVSTVNSVLMGYREVVGLQLEAFWKRNYLFLVGAVGVVACFFLWRIMFGVANSFISISEGIAEYGFLSLAASIVAFAGLYLRSRYAINPDRVYRMAMRKLNTSAAVLEVMGAPLTGTDLRAYVVSGGGPKLEDFKIRFVSRRCFLIFPVRGSERRGLASIEVKKKKGKYDIKLLAVDVPIVSGQDQRIFLVGDEQEYRIGGGLISELRDPIVKAMAATKEFDELDRKEAEEDKQRELEEADRKRREEEEEALRREEEAREQRREAAERPEKASS